MRHYGAVGGVVGVIARCEIVRAIAVGGIAVGSVKYPTPTQRGGMMGNDGNFVHGRDKVRCVGDRREGSGEIIASKHNYSAMDC